MLKSALTGLFKNIIKPLYNEDKVLASEYQLKGMCTMRYFVDVVDDVDDVICQGIVD